MGLKRLLILLSALLLTALSVLEVFAAEPKAETVAAALKEGKLYIYAALGQNETEPLIREFAALYPGIKVDVVSMSGIEVFNRHMRDIGAKKVSADILWSREAPLQAALVKNDYALRYRPAAADSVLSWAVMGDLSYATAFEPVVMVYNKKAFPKNDYPTLHKGMIKTFREARYKGTIGTCDPEKSELAFLLLTQDLAYAFDFWALTKSFGAAGLKLFPDYGSLLAAVSSGEISYAYNVPLSEAVRHSLTAADTGWYYPADYALALAQIAVISQGATNPNAAKLWVEFVYSKTAQQIISARSGLFPLRGDSSGDAVNRGAGVLSAGQNFKPAGTGAEVSRYNESGLRKGFILRWKQLLGLVK